jgi:hypothetical protein
MQIFNVGPLELLFILILAFVVLGPQDMVTHSRRLGRLIYRLLRSPLWLYLTGTARELQELPRQAVREAAWQESLQEIHAVGQALPVTRWEEIAGYPVYLVEQDGVTASSEEDVTGDKP